MKQYLPLFNAYKKALFISTLLVMADVVFEIVRDPGDDHGTAWNAHLTEWAKVPASIVKLLINNGVKR